mgnify:CR=1 FL=1
MGTDGDNLQTLTVASMKELFNELDVDENVPVNILFSPYMAKEILSSRYEEELESLNGVFQIGCVVSVSKSDDAVFLHVGG